MLRLTVLGRTILTGTDAPAADAVISQPKRLALLTYIALAENQTVPREELLAAFWGDSDSQRSHGAARKAIHFLRDRLGEKLLTREGGSAIALSPGAIWCDAVAFKQEVRAGNYVGALALYNGEFLSGIWLEDCPEIEQWIDLKRRNLRESAAASALKLSEAEFQNDNIASAMFWATRAELLSPDTEQITARIIALLDAAGDRTAAIKKYDDLVRRLNSDFDCEPSPETRDLISAIRGRSVTGPSQATKQKLRTPITGVPILGIEIAPEAPAATDPLRHLIEDAPDVIFTADPQGYFTYTNRAGCNLLGRTRSEIVGRLFVDFIREDFRIDAIAFYLRQVQQRIPVTYYEFPVTAAEGKTVWLGQNVRLRIIDSKVTGIEAIARDITADRKVKKAAERLASRAGGAIQTGSQKNLAS